MQTYLVQVVWCKRLGGFGLSIIYQLLLKRGGGGGGGGGRMQRQETAERASAIKH